MASPPGRIGRDLRRVASYGVAAFRLLWSESDRFARRRLCVAILLVLASSMLAAAAPLVFKLAVDALAEGGTGFLFGGATFLVVTYALGQWLARAAGELRWLAHGRAEQRLIRRLSLRVFGHVLDLPLRFHLDRSTGALGRTLANGITGCRIVLEHAVFSVLPAAVQAVLMATVLAHLYRPAFLLILALSLIAYGIVFSIGAGRMAGPVRTVSAADIAAGAAMTDGILNYETIKYFNAERRTQDRFDKALARSERQWTRFYRRHAQSGLLVTVVFALSLGSSVVFAEREVARGAMTIGDFVLVNAYILQIVAPLELLGFALRDMAQGAGFIEKLLRLMDEAPETSEACRTLPEDGAGELVFDRLCFGYRTDRPILDDLSFVIPGGKTVAIVGESGSGKSTLVRLLVRLLEPGTGRILFDGIPIHDLPLASLRKAIAVVPQDPTLFNTTLADNLAVGLSDDPSAGVEGAMEITRLHHLAARMPNGYSSPVGERGVKLSGGERQRVAIARAMLRGPKVFVFDEATSSLDNAAERALVEELRRMTRGYTTLIIAHRLSSVVDADEILVLDHGQIVERGTHGALIAGDSRYMKLWQAQQCQREGAADS